MHRLMQRLLLNHFRISDEEMNRIESSDGKELEQLLARMSPEACLRLLQDVERVFSEYDDTRRRLSHALRISSDELYQANTDLEQKAADQAKQLGLLNATLASTPDGVLVVDHGGRLLNANDPFLRMWRIPDALRNSRDEERMLAYALDQLEDPQGFLRRVRELYRSHEASSVEELSFKDGRVLERRTSPVRIHGRTVARIWLFRDVTAQRRAEREKVALEEQLRHSQKMEAIGKLAGGVAHDFNNLLTVILGHCETLLLGLREDEESRRSVEQVRHAGIRAAELTQQLLAFSRRQRHEPKLLDLAAVVTDLQDMLRRLIGEDIELVTRRRGNPVVKADPGQLQQVILNLAVNARDAMKRGGRLVIETDVIDADAMEPPASTDGSPAYVRLAVSDTGCGMDARTQERAFEPFFTTKEKGTGLGLSTVYGIVKQSDGQIVLRSEPGRGTTFEVYLPHFTEQVDAVRTAPPEPWETPGAERIALVVEDEDQVRQLAREALELRGFRVLEARNGAEALEIAERFDEAIDLMLTDVVMPGMNGLELFERMSVRRPGTKVLFMSGYTERGGGGLGELPWGTAFVPKPFTPSQLARKARELLGGSETPGGRDRGPRPPRIEH